MSRGKFLFFTLLPLVILTQVVVLRWGPEALFFVTWLFLALTVQHDSYLSAVIGLAFLVTCPFLLIAKRDSVAEQAANYAYFFLAIGVLVQLEEMLIERYTRLPHKLDFSNLWHPMDDAFRRGWAAAMSALREQLAITDRAELVRLIQIVGTVGLTLAFLGALLTGGQLQILLPLLGGALLFPFLVWGSRLLIRALGAAGLLRLGLALVVLPLAAVELTWLYDLVSADRLARMQIAYDFIDQWETARQDHPQSEGETIALRDWTIENETRRVLYQHPAFSGASHLTYSVHLEQGAKLAFAVAMAPESWTQPGDGATFAIYLQTNQDTEQLFSTYIDPKHNEQDRRWHSQVVDLNAYAGQTVTLIFETGIGPGGDFQYDWAGWGEPQLLIP